MPWNVIGFLGFNFVGMTILNRLIEGAYITASDVSILNTLTVTHDQTIFGIFTVPVINTEFFSGLLHLIKWDYSFFGGNAAIIQFLLYGITFAAAFGLFILIIGMVGQYFARR